MGYVGVVWPRRSGWAPPRETVDFNLAGEVRLNCRHIFEIRISSHFEKLLPLWRFDEEGITCLFFLISSTTQECTLITSPLSEDC